MNTDWTKEWPTTPGWYWFYGVEGGMQIRLMSVEVVASNKKTLMYKAGMVYIYPGSADGVWQSAVVPELPKEQHET